MEYDELDSIARRAVSRLLPSDQDDAQQDIREKWLKYPPRTPAGAWLFANHAVATLYRKKKRQAMTAEGREQEYLESQQRRRERWEKKYPSAERLKRQRANKKRAYDKVKFTEKFRKHRREYMKRYRQSHSREQS